MTTSVDAGAIEDEIRRLVDGWVDAIEREDIDAIVELYAPSGMFMVPNAPNAKGRDAVRTVWEQILSRPELSLVFSPNHIDAAEAGDMAYDVGTYEISFAVEDGRVEDHGKYVVVWRRHQGEWKIEADIFNTDLPPQEG